MTLKEEIEALGFHEREFVDKYIETHSYGMSLDNISSTKDRLRIKKALRDSTSDISKVIKRYEQENPIPLEASRTALIERLVRMMDRAEEEGDTTTFMRCLQELNKMNKGNLANTVTEVKHETKIVGLIDLSGRDKRAIGEGNIIDITDEE